MLVLLMLWNELRWGIVVQLISKKINQTLSRSYKKLIQRPKKKLKATSTMECSGTPRNMPVSTSIRAGSNMNELGGWVTGLWPTKVVWGWQVCKSTSKRLRSQWASLRTSYSSSDHCSLSCFTTTSSGDFQGTTHLIRSGWLRSLLATLAESRSDRRTTTSRRQLRVLAKWNS